MKRNNLLDSESQHAQHRVLSADHQMRLRPTVCQMFSPRPMENRILKHRSCKQPEDVGCSVCYQW